MILTDVTMGLFAFLVALVSLYRFMAEQEFYRLTMMKRMFGRKRGLALHFVVSVALPLLLGIVFLTGGLADQSRMDLFPSDDVSTRCFDEPVAVLHDASCLS
ncbi:MAG: hypothetical protein IBX47_00800 [Desulfuromonadales bacterium]|nr:hypothetical protein [Desulfuromonadales bacterium]